MDITSWLKAKKIQESLEMKLPETRLTEDAVADGWALGAGGSYSYCYTETGSRMLKYQVQTGEIIKVKAIAPIRKEHATFRFQNGSSVSSSTATNLVGTIHTEAYDGYITVPEGADYIVITSPSDDTVSGLYEFDTVSKIQTKTDGIYNDLYAYATSDSVFDDEVSDSVNQADVLITNKAIVIALITDSHYQDYNLTYFEHTIRNIKRVNQKLSFDALVHLGDVIDGGADKTAQKNYLKTAVERLVSVGAKNTFITTGNHDNNSIGGAGNTFTNAEIYSMLHRHNELCVIRDGITSNYYADYPSLLVRMLFVDSTYDTYGFSSDTVTWLTNTMSATPNNYNFVIFTHSPTRSTLISTAVDYQTTVNGDAVESLLISYGARVLGYIHGHVHFDNVSYVNTYPEIAINCNYQYNPTLSDMPSGAAVPSARTIGTINEDCWDIMLILPEESKFEFIRFGAGVNRTIPFRDI